MAITLVDTVGGSSSNTYINLADADGYFERHLYSSDWLNAETEDRRASLVWSTQLLDQYMVWVGSKATLEQALRWPRAGVVDRDGYAIDSNIIPEDVRRATAEFARHLLIKDRTAEDSTRGFSELEADVLRLVIDKDDRVGVIPDNIAAMLTPHLAEDTSAGTGGLFAKLVRT